MSASPFHPQGFGQHTEAALGSHIGKRLEFSALPEDCEIWSLPLPADMLSPMVRAYLTAALWTEDDDARSGDYEANGHPAELWHLWAWGTIERAREDCANFARSLSPAGVSMRVLWENAGMSGECAGHDLWTTRNGHGSGFWDRDGDNAVLQLLTDAAHALGSCDLYQGDDNRLYFS